MNLFPSVILFVVQSVLHCAGESSKLNVLLIYVDDLRPLTQKNVDLPNIQELAANGVNFQNAFAQQALCAPSRNSMLTGRRPDGLHLYDVHSYWRKTVGNFSTLPQFFKQNGYDTYSVGKVFHPGKSSNFKDDYPYSWSFPPYHPPTDKYKDAAVCKSNNSKVLHKNLICPVDVNKQPGKSLPDLQIMDYARKVLEKSEKKSKPFFLAVGFHKPHIPFKFPKKYLERVPIGNVPPPKHPKVPKNMPMVAWHPWMDIRQRDDIQNLSIQFPMGVMPKPWSIKIKQSYYAAASYVDDLIGALMKLVDRWTTIVVLTSDHGWSLGENGLWAKYSNFDAALKVPLIISAPELMPQSIDTPVELVDVFPTLVELAQIPNRIEKCNYNRKVKTLCFDGESLVPIMDSRIDQKYVPYAISQYPRPSTYPQIFSDQPRLKDIRIMGYSVRSKEYRYTEWISFNNELFRRDWNRVYGVELYDHTYDPYETDNLFQTPEYKRIRQYLSKLLRKQVDRIHLI